MVLLRENTGRLWKVVCPCFIILIFLFLITAVYLLNRIPSSILNFISPWEKLYGHKQPLHALKTFGCAVYPYLRPYVSSKFDPKSSQGIFFGYPPQSKGYICLDVLIGRIYISCHCIFDESVFPSFPISTAESSSNFPASSAPFDVWFSSLLPISSLGISHSSSNTTFDPTPSNLSWKSSKDYIFVDFV